jgi:hypothetical protein
MSILSWMHISDWHQRGSEFDRLKVRDALIDDLRGRADLDPGLAQLDFVIFSGDLTFSGRPEEYEAFATEFLGPVLDAAGLDQEHFIAVPGNHDVDRTALHLFDPQLLSRLKDPATVNHLVADRRTLRMLLEPFSEYTAFAREHLVFEHGDDPAYAFHRRFQVEDCVVVVAAVNSALLSGRHFDSTNEVDDRGRLIVGQRQVDAALRGCGEGDICIGVMHHPLAWLADFEQPMLKRRFTETCQFLLHGHEHIADFSVAHSPQGDLITVPAGAAYDRTATGYLNGFSYITVDTKRQAGNVMFRRWSDRRQRWIEDRDLSTDGRYGFTIAPGGVDAEVADGVAASAGGDADREKQSAALRQYRRRIAREYQFADHRGIAGVTGSPLITTLPADDVYVLPRLVAADRPELRDRERELLRVLMDPAAPSNVREAAEEEYAAFTGSGWRHMKAAVGEDLTLGQVLQAAHHAVLIGSPGVGKSALTRFLARTCVGSREQMESKLGWYEPLTPILIPLAAFADAQRVTPALTLQTFLLSRAHARGGNALRDILEQELAEGRMMVLMDGVDEVPDSAGRSAVVQAIDLFLNDNPGSRCIVTSRPYGYVRLAGDMPHFQMPNFSPAQVEDFVLKYFRAIERQRHPSTPDLEQAEEEGRELLQEIGGNPRVAELATNPLMLVIISLIRYERAHLSEERVQLYNRAISTLLDTWNQWRSSLARDVRERPIPFDRLIPVWASVAAWMRAEKPTGVVHREELKRRLRKVIVAKELDQDDSAELAERYLAMAASSGLLEERANDIFAFWHPTFEEYLAAVDLSTPTGASIKAILPSGAILAGGRLFCSQSATSG